MQVYTLRNCGGLKYLTFPVIEKAGLFTAVFSTRTGGVSSKPYESLNLGMHVGDNAENVLENRACLCRAVGINYEHLVSGAQVHGDKVQVIDYHSQGRGAFSSEDSLPGIDAIVTNTPGVPLSSYYADCVPLFIVDPVEKVAALAHAGWKGTVLRIAQKTVEVMVSDFNCKPLNCTAVIGPCIGQCCYRVDAKIINKLKHAYLNWEQFVRDQENGQWNLDLSAANRQALLDSGLKYHNIVNVNLCTCCCEDLFYSYRRSKGNTGRMASIIEIN
ncbi:MAG: peptidoglycan editing factor PgeF [Clostridiales bacterium]|nr:peptidoglycan editing factor PgeF [Clostridiales bacterium]MCF8021340.1 peptidoglycan editing factor PgeF [Clostridiales bacterium]